AVAALGLDDRATVLEGRAEALGRRSELRGAYDVVVARGFAPPAVTAECGAPFLRTGGLLVVSEPPDPTARDGRWPDDGLALCGLARDRRWRAAFAYPSLGPVSGCAERDPRRVGAAG